MMDLADAALRKRATDTCPYAIPSFDDCPTCQRIYQRYIALRDAAREGQEAIAVYLDLRRDAPVAEILQAIEARSDAARAEQQGADAKVLAALKDQNGPYDDGGSNCEHCNRPLGIVTHIKGWNAALDHGAAAIRAQGGER